jgi:hypothetical protein
MSVECLFSVPPRSYRHTEEEEDEEEIQCWSIARSR